MTKLPINLDDLLRQRTVEGERIEYKAGWNPDPIIRTVCAFANDFENLGGGYVVIGQDCDTNGQPVFPPVGLADNQLDKIQRELLAACQLIQPPYFPVLSIEEVEGRKLIVLWAPGGQNRPYKAPESVMARHKVWRHFIHRYRNRRIGEFMKELDLIEGRATGIPKILKVMAANGSPPPLFETDEERTAFVIRLPAHPLAKPVTPEVTGEVERLLRAMAGEMSRQQLQEALALRHEDHFRNAYLKPALTLGVIEVTLPDKPRSSNQRYRLTVLIESLNCCKSGG